MTSLISDEGPRPELPRLPSIPSLSPFPSLQSLRSSNGDHGHPRAFQDLHPIPLLPRQTRQIKSPKRISLISREDIGSGAVTPLFEALPRVPTKTDEVEDEDTAVYPGPVALTFLMLGISLAAFLVALDRTIIATAIPRITDDFRSLQDVGWYGSAYLLTSCGFQPTYGKIFSLFDVRWSFVVTLGIFEVGSLACAVAPNSVTLIVGRAVAGLGCAGIFSGCMVIISMSVPLVQRPTFMAIVGAM